MTTQGPTVSTAQGQLRGKLMKNINNSEFYGFQGIPYAKPPINELRFKAPHPPESWEGTRDASNEGSECYSRHMILKKVIGTEDCLYLNVYTPSVSNKSLKPVMFWIHGGGFKQGSGKTDIYGPEYLLSEDVVLVTINYRLGIFGFLCFEDSTLEIPGNAGMRDIVMALKWVQKNITNFSGDPKNVTIFGESAGAAAVHYLVLSPAAQGLFHKAIAQSGSALNTLARGKVMSKEFAVVMNLNEISEKIILEKLMAMTVQEVFDIAEKVANMCYVISSYGSKRPFAPVVEKSSKDAFLTKEPIEIINSGNYNTVPMIFGYNTREGMMIHSMMDSKEVKMPKNFETLIPFTFGIEAGSETSRNIAKKIRNFYYGEPNSEDNIEKFYLFHTDNYFLRDILIATKRHAIKSPQPVYLYRMSLETDLNVFKKVYNISAPGVSHGDDIGYLFKTVVSPTLKPGSIEYLTVKRFVKIWTNFAKTGDPNLKGGQDVTDWKPVTKDYFHFIDIGKKLVSGMDPEPQRIRFWNEILDVNPAYKIY